MGVVAMGMKRLMQVLGVVMLMGSMVWGQDAPAAVAAPKGRVEQARLGDSGIYPGTQRDYWIYVPAQYDGSREAAVMIFEDGAAYVSENGASKAPLVMDELIHRGEMPVTIGIFVNPGEVPAPQESALPRFNRSYEYDALNGKQAQFLLEELLPQVAQRYKLTQDPNLRGICGASSGAMAAFTAAWERPDAFRRVYSMIGTYVGLRGGDELSTLIRKTEPKPLRVFLQDGARDNNIYCGDWWMANQMMERSLQYAGYEVEHQWDQGNHSHEMGGAILSQALRWLWADAGKQPVRVNWDKAQGKAKDWLVAEQPWRKIATLPQRITGLAAGPDGAFYVSSVGTAGISKFDLAGKVEPWAAHAEPLQALAFGPDKRLYACSTHEHCLWAWSLENPQQPSRWAEKVEGQDLVFLKSGEALLSDVNKLRVWRLREGRAAQSESVPCASAVTVVPDQSRIELSEAGGRYVWQAQLSSEGLKFMQPYHHLHLPPAEVEVGSQASSMVMTQQGILLVATAMGVQCCDQPGRVNLIMPLPAETLLPQRLVMGGPDGKWLVVACGAELYARPTQLDACQPWQPVAAAPRPRL